MHLIEQAKQSLEFSPKTTTAVRLATSSELGRAQDGHNSSFLAKVMCRGNAEQEQKLRVQSPRERWIVFGKNSDSIMTATANISSQSPSLFLLGGRDAEGGERGCVTRGLVPLATPCQVTNSCQLDSLSSRM